MSDPSNQKPAGRDDVDGRVSARLRALRVRRAVPAPGPDEPSDEELLGFIEGQVDDDERARLEERIARSPYATARVAVVTEALREAGYPLPRQEPVGRRAVRYVLRLAEGALTFLRGSEAPLAATPAFAVRDARAAREAPAVLEFEHAFGDVAARITVERVGEDRFELALALVEGGAPVDGRVVLRRDGALVESGATEEGACLFRGLPPARYTVEVRRAGAVVGELHVDVLGE